MSLFQPGGAHPYRVYPLVSASSVCFELDSRSDPILNYATELKVGWRDDTTPISPKPVPWRPVVAMTRGVDFADDARRSSLVIRVFFLHKIAEGTVTNVCCFYFVK